MDDYRALPTRERPSLDCPRTVNEPSYFDFDASGTSGDASASTAKSAD
jgi:hypothetical protein